MIDVSITPNPRLAIAQSEKPWYPLLLAKLSSATIPFTALLSTDTDSISVAQAQSKPSEMLGISGDPSLLRIRDDFETQVSNPSHQFLH